MKRAPFSHARPLGVLGWAVVAVFVLFAIFVGAGLVGGFVYFLHLVGVM